MLRCVPSLSSSSVETFNLVAGNNCTSTDMSVLERQRAVLQQRMYHEHEQSSAQELGAMHLYHQYQNLMDPSIIHHQSLDENSPNFGFASSEITSNNTSLDIDHHQRSFSTVSATNSSKDRHLVASNKKRKAEVIILINFLCLLLSVVVFPHFCSRIFVICLFFSSLMQKRKKKNVRRKGLKKPVKCNQELLLKVKSKILRKIPRRIQRLQNWFRKLIIFMSELVVARLLIIIA